jgi:hypothetical protein
MDGLTYSIMQDVVGWVLWFVLTHQLSKKAADKRDSWVTVDYTISTALLGLSTVCTALAMLLDRPQLLWGIAVPAMIIAITLLAIRGLRKPKTAAATMAAETQQAQPGQWSVRKAPAAKPVSRPRSTVADMFNDPLIMDIEARRMPA